MPYRKRKERRGASLSMEMALLTGGAASATGLYAVRVLWGQAYAWTRYAMDWAAPTTEPPKVKREYTVQRTFLSYNVNETQASNFAMLARDPVAGGGMLLVPCGIFYISSPALRIYELRNGFQPEVAAKKRDSEQWVRLPPHAYFLFHSALAWLPTLDAFKNNARMVSQAMGRVRRFYDDCMLHMLLNDVFFALPTLSAELKAMVTDLIDLINPTRYRERVWKWISAASPPTSQSVLEAFHKKHPKFAAMWDQDIPCTHPFFHRPKRTANAEKSCYKTLGRSMERTDAADPWDLDIEASHRSEAPLKAKNPYGIGIAYDMGQLVYFYRTPTPPNKK